MSTEEEHVSQNIQPSETLPPDLEQRYLNERDQIKDIYRGVWVWHGTGRYEDHGDGPIDILAGIAESREIRPFQDIWDGTLRTTETISATKIRPYAVIYSDMHLHPSPGELAYRDPRKVNLTRITAPHILSVIRNAPYLLRQKRAAKEWMERKTGTEIKGRIWQQAADFSSLRSIIPGDYPILIGFSPNAFVPIKTAGYIAASEVRTNMPIRLDRINHIEVPLKYVEVTETFLKEKGISLKVVPREFGEKYSSEFSIKDLISGDGFKK